MPGGRSQFDPPLSRPPRHLVALTMRTRSGRMDTRIKTVNAQHGQASLKDRATSLNRGESGREGRGFGSFWPTLSLAGVTCALVLRPIDNTIPYRLAV